MRTKAYALAALAALFSTCVLAQTNSGSFAPGLSRGVLDNPAMAELSGIAASARYPGMFWTHNDSGDGAGRLFLIDDRAQLKAVVNLRGIRNRDWEDIAVGPGPMPNVSYIYVGDIGDNGASYGDKFVYRLPEPRLNVSSASTVTLTITNGVQTIRYDYPDGPRDAEALMVDPLTSHIYVISKRERRVNLYVLPYPQSTSGTTVATFLRSIPFTQIVAADISADGHEILIKNYDTVYHWRKTTANEPIESAFGREAYRPPYTREPQGEAIAFDRAGQGYYTVSESTRRTSTGQPVLQPLIFYARR